MIESELFTIQKVQFSMTPYHLNDLLDGIVWVLSHRPDIFWEVDTTKHIWLIKGVEQVPYRIWHTFNDEIVTLLAIEQAD
ncbi:MAG: hypothetical protein C7B43_16680 [Sulfobacillus benefaciens]|uniref:Uncharacterized protein n=1 Tax=Sulfobacillus benefaciens TaxID=453960 RepID=A0A2T2WTG2_9FIRM|nr:MAG: hypothetical protein C7B43_16680 [Sulfobacillus benefaciens]